MAPRFRLLGPLQIDPGNGLVARTVPVGRRTVPVGLRAVPVGLRAVPVGRRVGELVTAMGAMGIPG